MLKPEKPGLGYGFKISLLTYRVENILEIMHFSEEIQGQIFTLIAVHIGILHVFTFPSHQENTDDYMQFNLGLS